VIKTFDTLYIHPGLESHPRAGQLVERIPHRRLERLEGMDKLFQGMRLDPASAVRRGKYNAALAPYPGRMVEGCPATPGMCCCRYRVINLITGCPIDCSYCILQGYLNRPTIFIYPELEKIFDEVDRELESCGDYPLRFGTGELSDSLALEPFTGFARPLLEFFRERPQCWFEFKTKSTQVESLLKAAPAPGNIVVSWSLNPQTAIDTEERGAAGLESRLEAARVAAAAGYRLGFHFDPIFHYQGWDKDYKAVVEAIYRRIEPGQVAWISLGTLRYSAWLAGILRQRFRKHRLLAGELFTVPPDNKYRYPQPIRIEIYRRMNEWIRAFDSSVYVYLCMESAAVFRWALGLEVGDDPLAVERGFPAPPGWGGITP